MTSADITTAVARFAISAASPASPLSAEGASILADLLPFHADATDAALARGIEIAVRLSRVLDGHVEGGWSARSAPLVVASAVVATESRGLSAHATERALGLAATQAGGLDAVEAGPLGIIQRTHAVRAGVEAAELAAIGMEGHLAALEGRRGLFALMAPSADLDEIIVGLGKHWISRDRPTERIPA